MVTADATPGYPQHEFVSCERMSAARVLLGAIGHGLTKVEAGGLLDNAGERRRTQDVALVWERSSDSTARWVTGWSITVGW